MSYKPKRGEPFYMMNSRGNISHSENNDSEKARKRIAFGNAFKTEAEAEKFRDYVRDLAQHGYYNAPRPGWIAKILTWLAYLLLVLIVIAACCLVIDFIFWIFDIKVSLPGWLKA